MTVLTCSSTGKSITLLGEPIADSGEGKVWRTNHNGYLAKIYHSQTPEHVQKLAVMIAHRPKEPNSHLNHISFAWPKSVLKDAQANCVGFLMPEIKEAKQLLDVYNPKKRKALKLDVDWRFFHTTALNIASIIEAIHISGYVLGDIKPQNILVNDRALPSIIDTDSFQVRNPVNGKIYRCSVGSPDYTPPELIDKDFSSIDQTEVHDRFRLAVIIYQLLFGGESPFAGKWIGTGETPETNELIRRGLWLYAPNRLIKPVERTITLEIVHPELQRCFLRCFNDSNLRPTAGDWVKALRLAVNELTICGKADSHYYSRTCGKCYWCDRSTKLGIDIFPGFVKPKQQAAFAVSTSQPKAFATNKIIENVAIVGQICTLQEERTDRFCLIIIGSFLAWVALILLVIFATGSLFSSSNNSNSVKDATQKLTQSQLTEIATSEIKEYTIDIGISFQVNEETKIPKVTNVLEKSPAALRNIKVADQILEVNGRSTSTMSATDVANLIQADVNTVVFLLVKRCSSRLKPGDYGIILIKCQNIETILNN
ncbi:PDZ domain-containing protein [Nostoc sp. UIC 10607]|uniref:PDZ domain-containing protein n=1 Tax=Nostoc sp. UIC 10607 TaxID=3045935 RepID=UPI0039A24AC8